jgi:periplasmic protein TonB
MTEAAVLANLPDASATPEKFPPVKPPWLTPVTTVVVILAHIGVAAFFTASMIEKPSPLDNGLSVDLIPEGDTIESEQQEAMEISEPQPEEAQEEELAVPPPLLMAPDPVQLPQKQETVEPQKHVEAKPRAAASNQEQKASERHRLGVAGGRAATLSRASYAGLLAAAIHRHVPQTSTLGVGSASCSFHVAAGGGMGGVSCSGSSPTHVAMLRSAIFATHAPPPPGGDFFGSQSVTFH